MKTTSLYDESRPHPWIDPVLQGIGDNQRPAIDCITVRNPIRRMRKGVRDGTIDWHSTAEDLAKQLHGTRLALEIERETVSFTLQANDKLSSRIMEQQKLLDQYHTVSCAAYELVYWLNSWWAWRLFAPRSLRHHCTQIRP